MKLYVIKFRRGGKKYAVRVYAADLEAATAMVRLLGGEPYALVMRRRGDEV